MAAARTVQRTVPPCQFETLSPPRAMSRPTKNLLKALLHTLHATGLARLMRPLTGGNGVIFMLHQVTPDAPRAFDPNGILRVTPDFLDAVIRQVKKAGFDCIALDDVPARLQVGKPAKPFAVFTLDDGYKDNRDFAYPVFKRHAVPFTIYVPSAFGDGTGDLWWLNLEATIRAARTITLDMDGDVRTFDVATDRDKSNTFDSIYWWLRELPEKRARAVVRRLAREAGVDVTHLCRDLVLSWVDLRELAKDPLVTIGAHTTEHFALAKLPLDAARREMQESIARVSAEIGRPCRHFSYPYGCEKSAGPREFDLARELGVATAVTTRKGLIYDFHRTEATSLPRLSLNGDFQDSRFVEVLLSGAPFALWNAIGKMKRPALATAAPDAAYRND